MNTPFALLDRDGAPNVEILSVGRKTDCCKNYSGKQEREDNNLCIFLLFHRLSFLF